jgi:hypothetical protein
MPMLKDSNRVPDPSTLRRWSNGVDRSQLVCPFSARRLLGLLIGGGVAIGAMTKLALCVG